jgi:hypothetical protein
MFYYCCVLATATQNPMVPVLLLSVGVFLWLVCMGYCFYFIRKVRCVTLLIVLQLANW